MNKVLVGVSLGITAGVLDVIPMIIQHLPIEADISAFTMWVVVGYFDATSDIKINSILKGILTAYLVLLPSSFIIGWKEPESLIPIFLMTTILGGLLGYTFRIITKKNIVKIKN